MQHNVLCRLTIMSSRACAQGRAVRMETVHLLDIFFLFLLSCPSMRIYVVGEKVTIPPMAVNLPPLSNRGSRGTSLEFHQHHHHHQHPHSYALALASFTTSPSYLQDQPPWMLHNGNGNDDADEDRINYIYGSNSINTYGNLPLMSELTLMSGRNDSLEALYGESNTSGANGTEMYEEDEEEEESAVFEANIPWWRKMIWSILFGAMVVVACTGNVTVIWIVLAHKRMRTVTNYLLVNLSIADAMSSTLNVIPNYSYMLTGHWPFGALYCRIVQFVSMLSICASVFSLMAIAFDRYMAIMNPLRPRMGKRLTLGIAAGIWIGGVILSMPMLIFFQTFQKDNATVVCYSEWPDGPQTESRQENLYNVFFMIFTYFIPIAVMGYTYTRVGVELWGSKSIGECTQRQLDNIKSKRRVVKMMITVLAIFTLCWLPYHMYFIWVSLWPVITTYSFVQEVYLGIYWLAMSNSMYNPIIYCWMNNRFRRGFQQVFRWCPFVHYSEVEATTTYMMHTQRERETTRYSVTGSPELQLTRVSRNGSGSVHIHLHVTGNESGRSPLNKSMNTNSSNVQSTSGNQGHHVSGHSNLHNNGSTNKHNQPTPTGNFHQHHTQCHHLQKNFSSSNSRGNTMV